MKTVSFSKGLDMTDPPDFSGFVNNQQFQKSDPSLKKGVKI